MNFKDGDLFVLLVSCCLCLWIGAQLGGGVCGRPVTLPMMFEQAWISLFGAPQNEQQ